MEFCSSADVNTGLRLVQNSRAVYRVMIYTTAYTSYLIIRIIYLRFRFKGKAEHSGLHSRSALLM